MNDIDDLRARRYKESLERRDRDRGEPMTPTEPGFYWVRWLHPDLVARGPLVVGLTDREISPVAVPDDEQGAHPQDFEWLHPNPLTPPGPVSPDSELPAADFICANCGGRAHHHPYMPSYGIPCETPLRPPGPTESL